MKLEYLSNYYGRKFTSGNTCGMLSSILIELQCHCLAHRSDKIAGENFSCIMCIQYQAAAPDNSGEENDNDQEVIHIVSTQQAQSKSDNNETPHRSRMGADFPK